MRRPRLRQGSLRSRLAAVLAITVAAVVLVIASVTYLVVDHQLQRGQDVALMREATRIQRLVQAGSGFLASGTATCRYASEPACTRLVSSSDPIERSSSPMHVSDEAHAVAAGNATSRIYTVASPGRHVRVVALSVARGEAVLVGIPTTTTDQTSARVGLVLLVLGVIGVLVSGLIGFVVASIGLAPVRRLSRTIDRVSTSGDPLATVTTAPDGRDRDDELGRLSRAFDLMLERLGESLTAQKQLVADASHELRTPLTSLRTNFTLLKRGDDLSPDVRERLTGSVESELASMQTLVGDLVDLARGTENVVDEQRVDLREVAAQAVKVAARHWPLTSFVIEPGDSPSVLGSAERLERLLSVLLDNAGKYGGDGDVRVALRAPREPEHLEVTLTVADDGPGVPEDERERVFDRFYRSPEAAGRPGSGLGLAIARQIVAAHGGSIHLESPGLGSRFVVGLPPA